jgi:putative salt-induced outer membrane protein YdiY
MQARFYAGVALALLAVLGMGQRSAQAQTDTNKWKADLAAGLTLTTGNSDSVLGTLAFKAEKLWQHDEAKLGIGGAYGKSNGEINNETINAYGQYNHLFNERFYGSVRVDGLHDGVADVQYRIIIGPAAGYYFIKSDRTRFNGEVGPSFVYEKVKVNASSPPPRFEWDEHGYVALRFTERLEHKISDTAKCWEQVDYLPPVDDFTGNFLIIANAGIEVAINTRLALRSEIIWKFDNEPSPKKRSYDISEITSLVYKF